ncbi:hypothetical protein GYMLUDRAFT_63880 [Collybiopsis luxurians FD-317 M1]|uniref:Uncharacterized protein n=1 Tax=Collybiopsis luxurians FD-317 M1 TaxID=944289 RepID=A0A0D0ARW3_9AGAR|nr:hypothetical protein GYMLUDRAFT_63880 [Collybiopsis luxurians FD-317 M1]
MSGDLLQYGHPIDWELLFKQQINRYLWDSHQAKPRMDEAPEQAKTCFQLSYAEASTRSSQSCHLQKFTSRQEVASIMLQLARSSNDQKGIEVWSYILLCLAELTQDGLSDEEDDLEGNEQIRLVADLDFRHPDLHLLFQKVDHTW